MQDQFLGRTENSAVSGNSPSPKRRQSPSPRRRLSTGRIHENFEKQKSPSRNYSTDGNFANAVRLPHSLQPVESACRIPDINNDWVDLLPSICSCLLGLCGCGCGPDLCSIIPKLCSFLAGLCGSTNNSGVSVGQNYTIVTDKVPQASIISFTLINLSWLLILC